MITKKRLDALHDKQLTVAIVGDVMLDRYVFGSVTRVSPEAPVPVCHVTEERAVLGGSANVARNLAEFGCKIKLLGVIGKEDSAGLEIKSMADSLGIDLSGCIEDPARPSTVKTRIIGGGQQITRVDRETNAPICATVESSLIKECLALKNTVDLVIVSDYAKGVLTQPVVDALREVAEHETIVAVDPHPSNRVSWRGFSVIKPNLSELKAISGVNIMDYVNGAPMMSKDFLSAINELNKRWSPKHILVTLNANGMYYKSNVDESQEWLPTHAAEVFDVSGAGDTSVSFFALALAAGWNGLEAMTLANAASGIVVRKIGTASVSIEELMNTIIDSNNE